MDELYGRVALDAVIKFAGLKVFKSNYHSLKNDIYIFKYSYCIELEVKGQKFAS